MPNRVKAKLRNLERRREAFEKLSSDQQRKLKKPGSRKK